MLCILFLAFLTALLLRFLLRTSALVEGAEVDFTQYVDLWSVFCFALQGEYLGFGSFFSIRRLVFYCGRLGLFGIGNGCFCLGLGFLLRLSLCFWLGFHFDVRFNLFCLDSLLLVVCRSSRGSLRSFLLSDRFWFFFLFYNRRCLCLAHGSSHRCSIAIGGLLFAYAVEVNLAQGFKLLALFQQVFSLVAFLLGLLCLFILGFLRKYHFGLCLHSLVTTECTHQSLVL